MESTTTFIHTYLSGATLTREGHTLILRGADGREIDRHTFDSITTAVAWWCTEAMR